MTNNVGVSTFFDILTALEAVANPSRGIVRERVIGRKGDGAMGRLHP